MLMRMQRCGATADGQLVTHGDGIPTDARCVFPPPSYKKFPETKIRREENGTTLLNTPLPLRKSQGLQKREGGRWLEKGWRASIVQLFLGSKEPHWCAEETRESGSQPHGGLDAEP